MSKQDSITEKPASPILGCAESKVPEILESYTARIRALSRCSQVHISHARESKKTRYQELENQIKSKIEASGVKIPDGSVFQIQLDRDTAQELQDSNQTPHDDILAQSLLIFGFSNFDAFLGALLKSIYYEQPKLLH